MTHSVSSILRSVNSASSVEDILKNLGRLRSLVTAGTDDEPMGSGAGPDAGPSPPEPAAAATPVSEPAGAAAALETLEEIESQLRALQDQFDYVDARLARFEADADARLFEGIERVLERTVVDYQSAYNATCIYTLDWFRDALISENAKPQLAAAVLAQVRRFCPSNLKTLELVAERDPETVRLMQRPSVSALQS